MSKQVICIDFDGVIYDSTLAKGNVPNLTIEPITGSCEFLMTVSEMGYDIVILSCRAFSNEGRQGIRDWLEHYSMSGLVARITNVKEGAVAYIDNRAVPFDKEDPDSFLDALDRVETCSRMRG